MATHKLKNDRPTFYLDLDDPPNMQPVRAAGILVWTKKDDEIHILLARYGGAGGDCLWSDLGGKTEKGDGDPLQTAIRECSEETNCAFAAGNQVESKEQMMKLLDNSNRFFLNCAKKGSSARGSSAKGSSTKGPNAKGFDVQPIYIGHSKYALYPVQVKSHFMDRLTSKMFGEVEHFTGYEREMKWWSLQEFLVLLESNQIHFRLREKLVQQVIKLLGNQTGNIDQVIMVGNQRAKINELAKIKKAAEAVEAKVENNKEQISKEPEPEPEPEPISKAMGSKNWRRPNSIETNQFNSTSQWRQPISSK